jgi:nitrogen fixation/metabolism regulation signal transduction histidine kinase
MKLRTQYILLIILLHLTTLVLSFLIFEENKIFFIISEAVILLSLYFSIRLYRALVQPLELILSGIEAIKNKDFNVKFLGTGKKEMDQLIDVYNRMIDELRAERRAQEEQHYFLDKLIQSSPTGILILDFEGRIERINPKGLDLLGLSEKQVKGQDIKWMDHPIAREAAEIPVETAKTISINGLRTFKCQKSHFVDRGFRRQFIMIEELTEDILRTEKRAYGKVIRMMAHEVNNSIGPINSILESALFYKKELKEEHQEDFEQALKVAAERNDRLNRFMQNFAEVVRLPEPHKEMHDLRKLVESSIRLMKVMAEKKGITLFSDLPASPVSVPVDIYQLEQVLVNILKNAIEAIEDPNGRIEIKLNKTPMSLSIRNNGAPIPKEKEQEIFSPFFSTKKEGQGIGLTLTREILMNHGASFSLTSREDGWTYFDIGF